MNYICICTLNGATFHYGPFNLEDAYKCLAEKNSQKIEGRVVNLLPYNISEKQDYTGWITGHTKAVAYELHQMSS